MGQFRGPLTDVRYLQAAAEHVADLKSQSLDALGLVPGATVLDVGCGPGADVQALAAAKAYRVVGVDICLPMLGAARTGAATRAAFICANATSLPFSDGAFDAVRSERMLQHLPDPASAVTEMVRVTRPGGRLVLIDTDWASLTIEGTGAPATGQLLKDILLQHVAASPTAGRDLPTYAARDDVQTLKVSHTAFTTGDARFARLITHLDMAENTALTTGLLDEPGLATWRASLASASRRGTLRCSLTLVMLLAVRCGGPACRSPPATFWDSPGPDAGGMTDGPAAAYRRRAPPGLPPGVGSACSSFASVQSRSAEATAQPCPGSQGQDIWRHRQPAATPAP